MELDGRAQLTRSQPQEIPLVTSPGSPLDDYDQACGEELLRQLPLQRLNPRARRLVPQIDSQLRHPLVGGKPYCAQLSL